MTDPTVIASVAVGVLASFVSHVAEGATEKIGEELYDFVKRKLKGDREGLAILELFASEPDAYSEDLMGLLARSSQKDSAFSSSLESFVGGMDLGQSRFTQIARASGDISQSMAVGGEASASSSIRTHREEAEE